LSEQDRLVNIVEQCRAELEPDLSAELVSQIARIQVQFQFAGDDRAGAQKEMKAAIAAALPLTTMGGAGS
jgi:hypothetical protein